MSSPIQAFSITNIGIATAIGQRAIRHGTDMLFKLVHRNRPFCVPVARVMDPWAPISFTMNIPVA